VARVAVDVALAHLDRPFDYAVPASMDAAAVVGSRVRVRFAGQLVDGFVLERRGASEHVGRLTPLARVVSAEPALSAEVVGLARAVADRYAGTLADVLRLAVPPRHARVETGAAAAAPSSPPPPPATGLWAGYPTGPAFLRALAAGRRPRAVWTALPGPGWPAELAAAVQATLAGGRGAVVVVPDARDVSRVDAALRAVLGAGRHVALTADLGPAERYRRWLAVRRGAVRAVVGTRAAAFAPVADLGLVAIWDDGDDLHAEPRAPYPHARDVLVTRAHRTGSAALLGGSAQTAEGAALVAAGWARPLAPSAAAVRARAPRVEAAGDETQRARDPAAAAARLPSLAWAAARESLHAGAPVLVQVPRRGYRPALACRRCRTPARCTSCAGPLGQAAAAADSDAVPACRWCGRLAVGWSCPVCAGSQLRATMVGARRTAEELGRAFPGTPVRTSGRDSVLTTVAAEPALVVATPGAEPLAEGGYGAVLLLDGWALLTRPDLRAGEEALRRWLAAAALARPADVGGRVVVMADGGLRPVQALVRWRPSWHAERELAERTTLGFPPAVRMAAVSGEAAAVADLLALAVLPASAQVLGPVPVDPIGAPARSVEPTRERALVRVPLHDGAALATALHVAVAARTARKAAKTVRVQLDPLDLL
jgi:primosomal protein N' (replication factor Y)